MTESVTTDSPKSQSSDVEATYSTVENGSSGSGNSSSNGKPSNGTATDNSMNPDNLNNYFAVYDAFKDLCQNNAEYFQTDDTENGQRLHGAFIGLSDHLATARTYVKEISAFAHEYDFSESVPGNGYRSFLLVVRSAVGHGIKLSSHIMQNRSSLLFRKSMYMKEIEACNYLLASLCTCLKQLLTIREWSDPNSLFPSGVHTAAELFATANSINQYSFYGRCLGVQYCDSMQSILRFLSICMAGFSEAYYKKGGRFTKTTSSMWTGGQYYWNPELRARRIVHISQNSQIDFCKSFWSLAEIEVMHLLPSVVGSKIKINKVITIPPEPLQLPNECKPNVMVDIPIPASHLGLASISARLLSHNLYSGMMGEKGSKSKQLPPSDSLIFHCHGGGFVAQSSRSHELYLREWAVSLNVPILSIDYSLAPDAPFPRAIEEVFYAYCWAIKNCTLLGTTGKRIILAGDSAGANLNMAVALKSIEFNIRKPDGLFLAYCPLRISFDPSPARLLCLMDPLLPFGFMMRCLKAYACPESQEKKVIQNGGIHEANNNASTSAASDVVIGKSTDVAAAVANDDDESDQQTYVHVSDGQELPRDKTNTSVSLDCSSVWEHLDYDPMMMATDEFKSPGSDGTSDTFASASLQSQTVGNTEMITPDESNGISFEEDSQPITIHKPMFDSNLQEHPSYLATEESIDQQIDYVDAASRPASATAALELDDGQQRKCKSNDSSVAEFVDKYLLDTSSGENVLVSVPTTKSEENILFDAGYEAINFHNVHNKIFKAMGSVTNSVSNTISCITTLSTPIESKSFSSPPQQHQRFNSLIPKCTADEFQFDIPKDPLLSPYWADDETLKQLPSIQILSVEMDPFLDDCVMFAKRLKSLNNTIGLDILPGLPHGFLNFVKVSKEAHAANKICIKRLAQLLSNADESNRSV